MYDHQQKAAVTIIYVYIRLLVWNQEFEISNTRAAIAAIRTLKNALLSRLKGVAISHQLSSEITVLHPKIIKYLVIILEDLEERLRAERWSAKQV